jgi:hypothetical protein
LLKKYLKNNTIFFKYFGLITRIAELGFRIAESTQIFINGSILKIIYYQSNAPFIHSYINPIVKINKKINIELNPQKPI